MACSSRVSALLVFALSLSFTLCTGRAALGDTLPAGSVAGDFNADGRLDVLVQPADATHPGEILLQDGTGALSIQVQVLDPGFLGLDWVRSDSVAHTGDFNGDGRADVLLQSKQSGGVQAILLTDSTSQLDTITQTIPANYMGIDWSAATHTLVTGDFNGDGHSDVLL
ncbi:MAG TPA: VCBS repeat-containing protein [Gammaproteobacteria bacterium]|nr:VCBS repeat-containing protein [Gammaproteobacteria bacterium]